MRAPTQTVVVVLAVLAMGLPALALDSSSPIDRSATASLTAQPVTPVAADVVTVFNSGNLRQTVLDRVATAARASGAALALGRSASVGMTALYRGQQPVQVAPAGFAYPMGTTVLSADVVAHTMGRNVSRLLAADSLIMSEVSAGLRGARPGDTAMLRSASGAIVSLRVAAVLSADEVGGAELLVSNEAGARLGITRPTRAILWGFRSRAALDAALVANGLVSTAIRIRRSWDPPDPDATLGMAQAKATLGEFAYRVNADGTVSQDAAWLDTYLPAGRELLNDVIPIVARCHNAVKRAIRAALAEVAAAGLAATLSVEDANSYGGCHVARFNRLTPDSALGQLSRHSWAMAIDINTQGSCQGCAPPDMDCRAVQIFRKHGFAWGGNFLVPDGMHFEWVGERRDSLSYPSRFCRNTAPAPLALDAVEAGRSLLYADDGLTVGEH